MAALLLVVLGGRRLAVLGRGRLVVLGEEQLVVLGGGQPSACVFWGLVGS